MLTGVPILPIGRGATSSREAAACAQGGHHAAAEQPHTQCVEQEACLVLLRIVLLLVGDHVPLVLQVYEPLERFFGRRSIQGEARGVVHVVYDVAAVRPHERSKADQLRVDRHAVNLVIGSAEGGDGLGVVQVVIPGPAGLGIRDMGFIEEVFAVKYFQALNVHRQALQHTIYGEGHHGLGVEIGSVDDSAYQGPTGSRTPEFSSKPNRR